MPVQKLVIDAGPLLSQGRDELLAQAEKLYTTPAVFNEIRDEDSRRRLELLKDDIEVVQPSKEAIDFVSNFAKGTGDFSVLSAPDIGIIALTYDLHDKTGLRTSPQVIDSGLEVVEHGAGAAQDEETATEKVDDDGWETVPKKAGRRGRFAAPASESEPVQETEEPEQDQEENQEDEDIAEDAGDEDDDEEEEDWDNDEGWITPSNLEENAKSDNVGIITSEESVSSALASRDFAVQNVAMQIGLDIIDPHGMKITQLRTYMQRCHACFKLYPIPKTGRSRQFCSRCGGHTLTRVTVSVDNGVLNVHLKSNMQWKTRGDKYSLPKPQSRRARRLQHDNNVEFYAEDQPEYQKAVKKSDWQQRRNEKLVEDWIGPGTGDSAASPFVMKREMKSQVRIGRGRHANSKRP